MYKRWKEGRSPAPVTLQGDMSVVTSTPKTQTNTAREPSVGDIKIHPKEVEDGSTANEEIAKIRLAPTSELTDIQVKRNHFRDLPLKPIGEDDFHFEGLNESDLDRWQISKKEDDLVPSKDILKMNILRGDFSTLPPPKSNVVRIFLSSTFSDMKAERNALYLWAHPQLQQFCQERGLEYQVVDMRWGVPDEAVDKHLTSDLCLHEIKVCQRLSAGPTFVTMLGNRYGYRPLQVQIPAEEFDCLVSVADESAKEVWKDWYKFDSNAVPPCYVLQPIGSVFKHFNDTKESTADLQLADKQKWWSISSFLYDSMTSAAAKAVEKGLIESSRLELYTRSVTEEEVYHGVLENPESNKQCVAFHRDLTGFQPYLNKDKQVQRYIDTIELDGKRQVNEDLQTRLHQLAVDKVPSVVGERNCCSYKVGWNEGGVTLEEQDHQKYLQGFCKDFTEKICDLIKDYSQGKSIVEEVDLVFSSLMKELEHHARFCHEKCSTFCGRSKVLDEVKFYLEGKHQLPLIIHGESGVGKTSVMAMVTQLLQKWFPDCKILLRFLGTSKSSSTVTALLQSVCLQLCYLYNLAMPSASVLENFTTISKFFHALLTFIATKPELIHKPLFILLDSLDQLSSLDGAHLLTWLPRTLPKNVHIIVSTIPRIHGILDKLLVDPLMVNGSSFIELEGLDAAAGADVLRTRLERSSRKLSQNQEEILIAAFQQCPQALYIKLAIDEALSWHSYDDPHDSRLRHSIQEAIIQLFLDLENKFGSTLVRFALGYITVSREGLSQVELEDVLSCNDQVLNEVYQYHNPPAEAIVRIPPLLWARISYDMKEYLTEREVDGKTVIFWYHRQFQEGARVKFVERAHQNGEVHPSCCGGYRSHSHRLHSDLAEIFSAESGIQRTIYLHHRKLTIKDADRCVTRQTLNMQNERWLNALPFHLMQPNFHCDETCQQLCEQTLCNFHWILAKLQQYSPSNTLQEYYRVIESCCCQHEEVVFMRDFLVLAEPAVLYRPTLLATEVLARLPNIPKLSDYPNIQKVIKDATTWLEQYEKPVIFPMQPCFVAPNGLMKSRIVGPDRLIAIPGDARFVVGSSQFFKIRLGVWSTSTNELLHILELPPGCADPRKTKIDHRGSLIVTVEDTIASKNGGHYPKSDIMLRVYNSVEGTLKFRLRVGKQDECTCLDLSPDGVLVAVASVRGLVYIIDLETQRVGCVEAHSGPVANVRICPNGSSIVTCGRSLSSRNKSCVTSWILPSLQQGHSIDIPFPVHCDIFYISKNSKTLHAICGENILLCFKMSSGAANFIQCLSPSERLTCLASSWDGQTAVVGGSKGHVWVVKPETSQDQYEPVLTTDSKDGKVSSLHQIAVMWGGQFAVGATNTGKIYIWHLPILRKVKIIDAHATAINGLSFSTDHELLFSSAPDLYIKLWRIGRLLRQHLHALSSKSNEVREATASPEYKGVQLTKDGKIAIIETDQGLPELWDVHQGQCLHALHDPKLTSSPATHQVVLSATGDKLMVASHLDQFTDVSSMAIHIWDMTSPASHPLLMSHTTRANLASFSPDSSEVVLVHRYNSTRCSLNVWSTETLKTLKEFEVDCGSWGKINNIIMTCDKRFAIIFVQTGQAKQKDKHYQLEVVDLDAQTLISETVSDAASDGPSPNASNVSVTAGSVVTRVSPPNRVSTYVQLGRPTEGSRYLVEIRGGQVWEIDAKDQTIHRVFDTATGTGKCEIKSLTISEDRQWLAIGTSKGTSVIFNLSNGNEILRTQSPHNQVWSMDISRDKSLLVCGHRNNVIEVWDTKSKQVVCDVMTHSDAAKLVITADNKHLVSIVDIKVKPRLIFLALQMT